MRPSLRAPQATRRHALLSLHTAAGWCGGGTGAAEARGAALLRVHSSADAAAFSAPTHLAGAAVEPPPPFHSAAPAAAPGRAAASRGALVVAAAAAVSASNSSAAAEEDVEESQPAAARATRRSALLLSLQHGAGCGCGCGADSTRGAALLLLHTSTSSPAAAATAVAHAAPPLLTRSESLLAVSGLAGASRGAHLLAEAVGFTTQDEGAPSKCRAPSPASPGTLCIAPEGAPPARAALDASSEERCGAQQTSVAPPCVSHAVAVDGSDVASNAVLCHVHWATASVDDPPPPTVDDPPPPPPPPQPMQPAGVASAAGHVAEGADSSARAQIASANAFLTGFAVSGAHASVFRPARSCATRLWPVVESAEEEEACEDVATPPPSSSWSSSSSCAACLRTPPTPPRGVAPIVLSRWEAAIIIQAHARGAAECKRLATVKALRQLVSLLLAHRCVADGAGCGAGDADGEEGAAQQLQADATNVESWIGWRGTPLVVASRQ